MKSMTFGRSAFKVIRSGLLPLLLFSGLLMASVDCGCEEASAHGLSLDHLSNDHESDEHHDQTPRTAASFSHIPHPLVTLNNEGDGPGRFLSFTLDIGFSDMLEHYDNAVLQSSTSSSSFGQSLAIAQLVSFSSISPELSASIALPSTRTLTGMETSPETPPPRA